MATYSTRAITSTRHEWIIPAAQPWGAPYEEICKAVAGAWAQFRALNGLPEDAPMPGDFARFHPVDEEIVISFTTEEQQ
ncbi:hypothetical protein [Streptomyces scopuliridis]|uniref:hypothetical protein n=1 Tax=Streptomyces scopuliridis TaxID=452529 RepID=UPI00368F18B0